MNLTRRNLIDLRKIGGHVNSAVAIAAGRGIVRSKDSRLLAENGGGIVLSNGWAQSLMSRMGFVKRGKHVVQQR